MSQQYENIIYSEQYQQNQLGWHILFMLKISPPSHTNTIYNHEKFNITLTNRFSRRNSNRKSIGALPLSKNNENLESRGVTLGKTQRKFTIKNTNKITIDDKQKTIFDRFRATMTRTAFLDQFLSPNQLLQEYHMKSHIGKGCFSTVSLAVHKQTNTHYALKTYQKIDSLDQTRLDSIKREVKNLKNLSHQNVVNLFHVFKDKSRVHLLMNNAGKQSLSGLLRKNKSFNERTAKLYFKQILSAVSYCHQQGICHRDIKPENILVNNEGHVKLIDFGFSAGTKNKLTTYCGTPPFMCPQITKKLSYKGSAADVWALGILLYYLIVGTLPFRATNEAELNRLIQQGKYPHRQDLPKQLRLFLDRMLECDSEKRACAQQLMNDPWLK